jgi:hypothetical protein
MPPLKRPAPRQTAQPRPAPADNGYDDEEDDEEPQDSRVAKPIRGGWTEGQRQNDKASPFTQPLKLEQNVQIVKFLNDEPYASFRRHWLDRIGAQGPTRRAFTCLESVDMDCPLCDVGERASVVHAFNVVLVGDDGQVLHKSWEVGVRLFNVLRGFHNDPKVGPLTSKYFAVSKSGQKQSTQVNVIPARASSLLEDYGVNPATAEELAKIKQYTPKDVQVLSHHEMKVMALEISEED